VDELYRAHVKPWKSAGWVPHAKQLHRHRAGGAIVDDEKVNGTPDSPTETNGTDKEKLKEEAEHHEHA
jgi:hypothetical protein